MGRKRLWKVARTHQCIWSHIQMMRTFNIQGGFNFKQFLFIRGLWKFVPKVVQIFITPFQPVSDKAWNIFHAKIKWPNSFFFMDGRFPKRSQKRSVPLTEKSFGEHLDQYKIMVSGECDRMKHCTNCTKRMTGNLHIFWKSTVGWTYSKGDQQQIPKTNFEMKSQI